MTKSTLELFNEVAKDFNIGEDKQLHIRQKQAFVESQIAEVKAVLNRLIVDTAKARFDLTEAKDDATKSAYQDKVNKFETDIRQFVKTLDFFQALAKDLGADGNKDASSESI